ncbi:MAG: hypothetical protein FWF53_07090 [Candidatus Azobacteroides sp.]|nr:hypothetical protein [Candidatus Azobacteroides sp.]
MKSQKMFMVFEPSGRPNFLTIHYQKKDSINRIWDKEAWKECKKYGWSCRKVKVTIEQYG